MAYKFQMGSAILSGALVPSLDDKFDLGTSGLEWKDGYFDGTLNADAFTATGTSTLATVDINGGAIDGTTIGAVTASAGTFTALVGTSLNCSDGDITNVGQLSCDAIQADDSAVGLAVIFDGVTTTNKVELTDNLADALNITQAGNSYIKFTTTNLSEQIVFGQDVTFASQTIANLGTVTTANIDGGTIDGMTIDTSDVIVGAGKTLNVSAGTLMLADDQITAAKVTGLDGAGLVDTAGVLGLDLNELAAASVDVTVDSIAIVDADDSNTTRKESIADLVAGMAGTGITASAGTLNVSAASAPNAHGDANTTLTEAFNYASATITANRTWTLPASAGLSVGDVVSVKAAAINAGFRIAIARAGSQTIDGSADSIFLDASYSAVQLKYVAADTWMIF